MRRLLAPAASCRNDYGIAESGNHRRRTRYTTITWNTGDGTTGQVYVSEDGAPETLFTAGPPGSAPAPWIRAGKTFEFRLYAGTEHAKVLAKTQVTGRK